jgi:hypothetical protein
MKKKRSLALLFAGLVGLAYGIYIISYFAGTVAKSSSTAEAIGGGIATALVLPHMLFVLLAVLFNILAWALNSRPFALTAGILYSVSAIMFILYALFVVPSIVLSFVGFARLKKIKAYNLSNAGELASESVSEGGQR